VSTGVVEHPQSPAARDIVTDVDDFDPLAVPRILSRRDADRLGYTPSAIRHLVATGRWRRVLPHTYLTAGTLTWSDRLHAATIFAGPDALLSGAAALCDRGLRSVARPSKILVLVPYERGPRSTSWVRVRPTARPIARELTPGPPRATNARAIADWAVEGRPQDGVRMIVAEAIRQKFCTLDELAAEVAAGPQRGSAFLREAIDEIGAGAWSAPEARAARLMRGAGLPPFEQNARIDLPGGRYVVGDFLWRRLRAVLEIDSDTHHALAGDADGTGDRHLLLETLGYSVVHRTPRLVVKRPAEFVAGISDWLAARGSVVG
jgi:very-short-patch-repair endonuclease